MARLMSVALTEAAVRDRTKTVTRRLGWLFLKPGDRLTLCRKAMGRFHGQSDGTLEPLVRIADVEVVSVRRERLNAIEAEDVEREGFKTGRWIVDPAAWFVAFFCEHMRCTPDTEVTRIEWRYLPAATREADR
jgi:hypothetical protein